MYCNRFLRLQGVTISLLLVTIFSFAQNKVIWEIGKADNQSSGLALSPTGYKKFLEHDFGWEDRYFIIGYSKAEQDFPYVLPGPKDKWGGTAPTSGIRSHLVNILFQLDKLPPQGQLAETKLVIDLLGYNVNTPPLLKVSINGVGTVMELPKGSSKNLLPDSTFIATEHIIEVPIKHGQLRPGGNEITITSLDGSWLVFDNIRLEGPAIIAVRAPSGVFLREAKAAGYELNLDGKKIQPLLLDVEHLDGKPDIAVKLDGKQVFEQKLETGRYQFEVPMPAATAIKKSNYEILVDGKVIQTGTVTRSAKPLASYSDYVDTKIGTAHSRWMIAPGPWMPFSMVKISPDNQNDGWQAGYDPTFETVGAFSHIHEWTMGGLGMLPVNGPLKTKVGDPRSAPG